MIYIQPKQPKSTNANNADENLHLDEHFSPLFTVQGRTLILEIGDALHRLVDPCIAGINDSAAGVNDVFAGVRQPRSKG